MAETAAKKPRLFELRIYESHSEAAALRKIEMFNEGGEIALFDRLGLRSVFFGQTLVGRRQPNLVYMTVHQDMAARERVWEDFRNSADWKKLSSDPAFANTVSATTVMLPAPGGVLADLNRRRRPASRSSAAAARARADTPAPIRIDRGRYTKVTVCRPAGTTTPRNR